MGGVAKRLEGGWSGKKFLFPSIVYETKVFRNKIEKKNFISIFFSTLGKINVLIEAMTLVSPKVIICGRDCKPE